MRIPGYLASVLLASTMLGGSFAHADDRDDARHAAAGERDAAHRAWVTLAAMDIQASKTVDIDENLGRFRHLRVQAIRGAAYVDFIEVRYANGEQQHIDVKRRIGRGETADIDLNGSHRLQAITVHGEPDNHSQIQVIGER